MVDDHHDALRVLTAQECRQRLGDADLARLAWADDSGTVTVIPVNFARGGDDVLIRTTQHLADQIVGRVVAFELDDIEPAVRTGWSVLIRGTAERTGTGTEPAGSVSGPDPWTDGERHIVVRIRPTVITGRRIDVRPGGVTILHVDDDRE